MQFEVAIPDEGAAIRYFTARRWKTGPSCPYCKSERVYHFSDGRSHKCGSCRKRFSIKVGTIFEDSKIPLRTWLLGIWILTSEKDGVASTELSSRLGITQKSAWSMTQRLRQALKTTSFYEPIEGNQKGGGLSVDTSGDGAEPPPTRKTP